MHGKPSNYGSCAENSSVLSSQLIELTGRYILTSYRVFLHMYNGFNKKYVIFLLVQGVLLVSFKDREIFGT